MHNRALQKENWCMSESSGRRQNSIYINHMFWLISNTWWKKPGTQKFHVFPDSFPFAQSIWILNAHILFAKWYQCGPEDGLWNLRWPNILVFRVFYALWSIILKITPSDKVLICTSICTHRLFVFFELLFLLSICTYGPNG